MITHCTEAMNINITLQMMQYISVQKLAQYCDLNTVPRRAQNLMLHLRAASRFAV